MGKPGLSVLVVDDDPDILSLFSTLLEDQGYEVYESRSGKGCLEAARTYHPDMILLDVMLPDMTGLEVCGRIKADPELRDAFVILVSGVKISSESQADGLSLGADGYIIKDIGNREFLARVESLVRIKRMDDALRAKEKEQQKLIAELQEALAEIKTLKGLIPICASCKKIRDDEGYWNQLEVYITKHTDAVFSHGFCPECAEEWRKGIAKISGK